MSSRASPRQRSNTRFAPGFGVGSLALLASVELHASPTDPGTLTHPLQPAQECRYCHQHPNSDAHAQDPPYAAFFGWQGSMMANAARDPVFWAAMALAEQDREDPEHTVDCVRCHAPRAFLEGRGNATTIEALEPEDLNGVDCEICHRMIDDPEVARGNAQFTIDDTAVGPGVPRRGPWAYDDGVPMPDPAETHATQRDPFTGSSALCGTCHDVTTHRERLDATGEPMGMRFNEQRTYREWLHSDFAQPGETFASCQDCHLPPVEDKAGCNAYVLSGHAHPTGGRRHEMLGANRFMMQVIRDTYGRDFGTYPWDLALSRIDEFLAGSATLEVETPDVVDVREGLSGLTVRVTNETGHKLPSGYSEGRLMWIEVVATYAGTQVWTSGRWDPATASVQDDPQVRRYEGIAQRLSDGTRNHLLLNDHWLVDHRIPPRGLKVDAETDPVGDRYTLTADGVWPHWDEVAYAFGPMPELVDATPQDADDDELQLTVSLLYLVNTPDYLDQLVEENTINAAGDRLAEMVAAAGGVTPVAVAVPFETSIPLTGLARAPSGETDAVGSTSSETTSSTNPSSSSDSSSPDSDTFATTETSTAPTSSSTDPGGCGCTTTPRPPLMWVGFAGLALFTRRRFGAPRTSSGRTRAKCPAPGRDRLERPKSSPRSTR